MHMVADVCRHHNSCPSTSEESCCCRYLTALRSSAEILPLHIIFMPKLILFLYVLLTMVPFIAEGGAADQGHPHQGKVPPFEPGDPKVKLDNGAIQTLQSGKPYQTQTMESGSSGRALVVQDVHAPTNVVWDRILDYDNYAKMVPNTIESGNYHVEKDNKTGHQTIFTRMKVGFSMIKLQFFVKHEYEPKLNSLTWTLDYSRKSDFDDSCGFWYVIPHPDNPSEWTRVYYSVQVSMFDWVPKFVVNFLSTKALTDATAWVKKFSELEYLKQAPKKSTVDKAASATATTELTEKPGKRGWFQKLLNRNKNKSATSEEDDQTCASTDDEDSQEDTAAEPTATTEKVGLKRYALVASVVVLSLYNVHLYFSQ